MNTLRPIDLARKVSRMMKSEGVSYDDLRQIMQYVRRDLDLQPTNRKTKLINLPSEDEFTAYFTQVRKGRNTNHYLISRVLRLTGLRVSEVCNLLIRDIELSGKFGQLRVESGKGGKDRMVSIPDQLRNELHTHITEAQRKGQRYLFETKHKGINKPYTTRTIQLFIKKYATSAKIEKTLTPHTFRHALLTLLTREGIGNAQIQLISGHSRQDTLAMYQHLSLADIAEDHNNAVRGI